jgi:hypothetical protein
MNRLLLFVLISSVLFTACTPDDDLINPDTDLAGTWQWISTRGGIANQINLTPASTGRSVTLQIGVDGRYTIYVNGAISSQGNYTIGQRNCIHTGTQKRLIDFSAAIDEDRTVENLVDTELYLSDEMHDGLTSHYRRLGR